ncbi:HI0933-like family protein [Rhodococcus sp. MTM3W5.2]|nr:HI0933-like family protein [Rhodococcus sp. MTM3W5.2]
MNADVIVVGAGLAGLVATHELVKAGRRVLVIDQENRNNLGGQAFWSLGGLFFVDSPEQRRLGIKDSHELALADWMGSAGFDREREDHWPRQWARAYVDFAATEKREYLRELGLKVVPTVGWAERGGGSASGHGNSVPRFHLTWGTGPEVVRIFAEPVLEGEKRGLVNFEFRHQVDDLIVEDGAVVGVRGPCWSRRTSSGARRPREPPWASSSSVPRR